MTPAGRFVLCALLVAACSDNGNHQDASTIDGKCGASLFFTGELVDWDSTESMFCGVFRAKFDVQGGTSVIAQAPNGRFELCIAPAATTRVDITPPATSVCASGGNYTIPGIAIANQAVINTGKLFSARAITMQRLAPFYSQFGLTYDAAKAGVFVHVEGTPHPVTLSASHDAPVSYDGTTWTAGSTGLNVFFPNVVVGTGTTMVTASGAIGEGSVPIAANTFTYVTLVGN
ncbi:MAG: hypothetical protein JWO36_2970 [Myxococcales bacterium]|nr:hypothetical protein [Myxococcales bacterium]